MTSGQKTALSLLTSTCLFAAFAVIAFTGLFSVIDARFYEPAKVARIQKHLDLVSENYDEYINTLVDRFGKGPKSFLSQKPVLSYIESKPDDEDVRLRSKLSGDLFSQTTGLMGMRLIDKNGVSIHYSTFSTDVLRRTADVVAYKDYTDAITLSGEKEFEYDRIKSADSYSQEGLKPNVVFDGKGGRIIVSFPFYDSYSAYRGTYVFYINANDFNRLLLSKKIITFGDSGSLVADTDLSGFVFGIPAIGKEIFENEILDRWKKGLFQPEKIVWASDEQTFDVPDYDKSLKEPKKKANYWILVSSTKTAFGYVGGIYPDQLFAMSDSVKILMLICLYITMFLIIFLVLNFKQDEMVVIRERIRRLQLGLVNEYLKKKENVDWKVVSGKIAERRQDVTLEILKSLGRKGKKHSSQVNKLINRSWDELLAAMNVQAGNQAVAQNSIANGEEIRKMLEEILSSGAIKVQATSVQTVESSPKPAKKAAVPVEVVEYKDDDSHKASPVTADDAEPLDDLEEVESLEEVEELTDAEPVEDLEEVESLEEVEELTDAEPVEDLEEVESLEEAEEPADAEPAESLEPAPEKDEFETVDIESIDITGGLPELEMEDVTSQLIDNPDSQNASSVHRIKEPIEEIEEVNRKSVISNKIVDEEDNEFFVNFKADTPDYSELDTYDYESQEGLEHLINKGPKISAANEATGLIDEPKPVEATEVSLAEFGANFKNQESSLQEEVGFGVKENSKDSSRPSGDIYFEVSSLDFKNLDSKTNVVKKQKKEQKILLGKNSSTIEEFKENVHNLSIEKIDDDASELEAVETQKNFSLTGFGMDAAAIGELEPGYDVIHDAGDGTYSISDEGADAAVKIDFDFKDLVDSVLKR
ncbi:MAG: hypothetical protein MJ169_04425 [Treponema sp.]|nr:hypothetical protein [Treponema sp.]